MIEISWRVTRHFVRLSLEPSSKTTCSAPRNKRRKTEGSRGSLMFTPAAPRLVMLNVMNDSVIAPSYLQTSCFKSWELIKHALYSSDSFIEATMWILPGPLLLKAGVSSAHKSDRLFVITHSLCLALSYSGDNTSPLPLWVDAGARELASFHPSAFVSSPFHRISLLLHLSWALSWIFERVFVLWTFCEGVFVEAIVWVSCLIFLVMPPLLCRE